MKKLLLLMFVVLLAVGCKRQAPAGGEQGSAEADSVDQSCPNDERNGIGITAGGIPDKAISADELLRLPEVHELEEYALNYNNMEQAKESPREAGSYLATHRDSAAMRLANRMVRMADYVKEHGNHAMNHLQWALAVNVAVNDFRKEVPSVSADSVIYETTRVMEKFSSSTQMELNMLSHVDATVEVFLTVDVYQRWLMALPTKLKPLAQEEFEAWFEFNEARFHFWSDVTYNQEWYSMKPMEYDSYYTYLEQNRRAELDIEDGIVLKAKPYRKKGKTVTAQQWEDWIAKRSVTEGIEYLEKGQIPSDSLIADHVGKLKTTFERWRDARQAFASALPKEQDVSYDNLTADMHGRIVGKLPDLVPQENR